MCKALSQLILPPHPDSKAIKNGDIIIEAERKMLGCKFQLFISVITETLEILEILLLLQ